MASSSSPFHWCSDEFMAAEWRVNGIWNAIIVDYFPINSEQDHYIVAPEAYPTWDETQSLAADLCVANIANNDGLPMTESPFLTYEGKGGKSQKKWPDIKDQIQNWCLRGQEFDAFGGVFCCWAIGAKGNKAQFFVFDGKTLHSVGPSSSDLKHAGVSKQDMAPVDITTSDGAALVNFMMTKIKENQAITKDDVDKL